MKTGFLHAVTAATVIAAGCARPADEPTDPELLDAELELMLQDLHNTPSVNSWGIALTISTRGRINYHNAFFRPLRQHGGAGAVEVRPHRGPRPALLAAGRRHLAQRAGDHGGGAAASVPAAAHPRTHPRRPAHAGERRVRPGGGR